MARAVLLLSFGCAGGQTEGSVDSARPRPKTETAPEGASKSAAKVQAKVQAKAQRSETRQGSLANGAHRVTGPD